MSGEAGLLLPVMIPIVLALVPGLLTAAGERKDNKAYTACGKFLFPALTCVTLLACCVYGIRALTGSALELTVPEICGFGLRFRMDGFRAVYAMVAAFAWAVSSAFALWYLKGEEHQGRYFGYTLFVLGMTLGVFLSADLMTTFIFFEGMSLASYVWVVFEEDEEAVRASKTYLAVAVIGGLVMLMGLFLLWKETGTLMIDDLTFAARMSGNKTVIYAAGFCMLFGFGAKAGAYPLHIWLPKAHPVAPAPASALLSGILTKAGMYGILILVGRIFIGDEYFGQILLVIAVLTMLTGAFIALFSIDIKHVLACSSVSQIGFILTGASLACIVKEEQWLAVQGAILHMMNHSFFKLVLFLLAGVLVKNLHSRNLNDLSGFGKEKPWFMVTFLLAYLGIAGIPGLSGFVSKSMIHEAIVVAAGESGSGIYKVVEWLFLIAGGCTLAYMTKLFIVLFFRPQSNAVKAFNNKNKQYLPLWAKILLSVPAAAIYLAGTLPEYLMIPAAKKASDLLNYAPAEESFRVFTAENVKGGAISAAIGLAVYFFAVRPLTERKGRKNVIEYVNRYPAYIDLENALYRPVLLTGLPTVCGGACRTLEMASEGIAKMVFGFSKLIAGFADRIADLATAGVRRTVLRPVCETPTLSTTKRFSLFAGGIANGIRSLWRKLLRKSGGEQKDYVKKINRGIDDTSETFKYVVRSLSYGLLAFCVGLLAMLLYLLYCLQGL
ncbi:MAG: sodium:proton antiporter [Lachnospiraceae bacterium]|nr:sodium:proton antiporter [Lachnospiraceae bacterium]